MVKEQKGRITELSKSKQEMTQHFKVALFYSYHLSVSLIHTRSHLKLCSYFSLFSFFRRFLGTVDVLNHFEPALSVWSQPWANLVLFHALFQKFAVFSCIVAHLTPQTLIKYHCKLTVPVSCHMIPLSHCFSGASDNTGVACYWGPTTHGQSGATEEGWCCHLVTILEAAC